MSRGRRRSWYHVVKVDIVNNRIWIADDNGPLSITNDAEQVVRDLLPHWQEPKTVRIFYRDSDGNWDELLHDGERFTGFGPAREMAP